MNVGPASRVFRVTVRGRFCDLSDEVRGHLASTQQEHDILESAYTTEGTFTYDARVDFFNLRYEIRGDAELTADAAATKGIDEAELFLRTMRFGFRDLKTTVVDMATMWPDDRRAPEVGRPPR